MSRLHFVPAEIGNNLGANSADTHSGQQRKSERAVYKQLLPLRLCCISRVKMDWLDIQGEQCHPDVVHVGDRSARPVFEHISRGKVLVVESRCFAVMIWAQFPICRQVL